MYRSFYRSVCQYILVCCQAEINVKFRSVRRIYELFNFTACEQVNIGNSRLIAVNICALKSCHIKYLFIKLILSFRFRLVTLVMSGGEKFVGTSEKQRCVSSIFRSSVMETLVNLHTNTPVYMHLKNAVTGRTPETKVRNTWEAVNMNKKFTKFRGNSPHSLVSLRRTALTPSLSLGPSLSNFLVYLSIVQFTSTLRWYPKSPWREARKRSPTELILGKLLSRI